MIRLSKSVVGIEEADAVKKVFTIIKLDKTINKTILFSPSAASFDTFRNFEDRGYYFNKLIKKHLNGLQ